MSLAAMFAIATAQAQAGWGESFPMNGFSIGEGFPMDEGATLSPKYETRAVWITTLGGLDWPQTRSTGSAASIAQQQRELTTILDQLQAAGINTVLLQTRVRGTVIYPSRYETYDACLTGRAGGNPGYDPLQFAITEAHRRGMELHAWVVTIPIANGKYMNPEDPQTGTRLAQICEEITRNYDIDGIHLDYIRYPEDWKKKIDCNKGRAYITDIVRKINVRVKSAKPWVKLSCSPVGKYDDLPRQSSNGWNARSRVMQDAQGWLAAGLMDQLYPMMYFQGRNFYPFALDWQEQNSGRTIAPGLGIYFLSPREKDWSLTTITQELHTLRQYGMGHALFRSRFLTDNTKGIYTFLKAFNAIPALTPPLTWENNAAPEPPTIVSIDSLTSSLRWSGAVDRSDGDRLLYNIYAARTTKVDTSDPRNLVATRVAGNTLRVPLDGRHYVVTALDRYGNESKTATAFTSAADKNGLPIFTRDDLQWLRQRVDELNKKINAHKKM